MKQEMGDRLDSQISKSVNFELDNLIKNKQERGTEIEEQNE